MGARDWAGRPWRVPPGSTLTRCHALAWADSVNFNWKTSREAVDDRPFRFYDSPKFCTLQDILSAHASCSVAIAAPLEA